MSDGKDGAIDVTVTSPLASSNVAGAEAQAGASLAKACQRKVRDTADACRREGLVFIPFAMETLKRGDYKILKMNHDVAFVYLSEASKVVKC